MSDHTAPEPDPDHHEATVPETARKMEARTNRALVRFFITAAALLFSVVAALSGITLYVSFHNRSENRHLLQCQIRKEDRFRADVAKLLVVPHPAIPANDSIKCVP
jgi:hypothetical protein